MIENSGSGSGAGEGTPQPDDKDRRNDSTVSGAPDRGALNRLAAGTRLRYLGDYEILDEIDRGGMGVVYRARQTSLDRVVALKVILEGEFATEDAVRRFRREAEAAAQLDHPNIVPIYEVGEHEGTQYFAMRLIEGASLRELAITYIDKPRAVAELIAKTARAVDFAHRCGVVHRDLKPANVLIDAVGEPHLTDFGLARRFTDPALLTMSTTLAGTPSYMAPEQASGAPVLTTAVDVYALGAILYELIAGQPPFSGESILEILRHVVEDEPLRPSQIRRGVERDLEAIALRCTEKRPEHRYRTAGELADDLERFLRGEPIQARPITWRYRSEKWARRHRTAVALSMLTILLLAGAAGAFESMQKRAARSREGEKIRAVLEKSVTTNAHRASISSYWPSFEEDAARYLRESGDETLRQLLRKNVIQVRAEVSSFGLVADPPEVLAEFACAPADVGIVAHSRLEGSFDGGAWVPLMTATCRSDAGFVGIDGPLDLADSFGIAATEGPHQIELRALVDFYDLRAFAKPPEVSFVSGESLRGHDGGFPDLAGRKPLASETRSLGERRVHLFEKIPASFPQRLPAAALKPASFDLRKIRFVVYDFGPDEGCVDIAWETLPLPDSAYTHLGQTICRPEKLESPRTLLRIEMAGEFELDRAAPLAGEAKIFLDGERDPAVTFDLAVGGGRFFGGSRSSFYGVPAGSRTVSLYAHFNEPVPWARAVGSYRSTLVLDPSREVALATGLLDRFVDAPYKVVVPSDVVVARKNLFTPLLVHASRAWATRKATSRTSRLVRG